MLQIFVSLGLVLGLAILNHILIMIGDLQFGSVVDAEFVKKSAWSELVPQLCFAIQNSDIISGNTNAGFSTVNALKALQALLRPFQVVMIKC